MDFFRTQLGLFPSHVIADIGSGTGISAEPFLQNGNVVFCVEPNEKMRLAAEEFLANFPNFRSIPGSAEATTLKDRSCDFIICAQAFHWFNREKSRQEFVRIARLGTVLALIWNERKRSGSPFLDGYEAILNRYESDYQAVAHDNITDEELNDFFHGQMQRATFLNEQRFDLAGLLGRAFSSSYTPTEGHPDRGKVQGDLEALFERTQRGGMVVMEYLTEVYFARMG